MRVTFRTHPTRSQWPSELTRHGHSGLQNAPDTVTVTSELTRHCDSGLRTAVDEPSPGSIRHLWRLIRQNVEELVVDGAVLQIEQERCVLADADPLRLWGKKGMVRDGADDVVRCLS